MTENKMTETEIMKALECCSSEHSKCKQCPNNALVICRERTMEEAVDLINRKNAEIAEKDAEIEGLSMEIDELIIAKDQLFDEAEALIKKARAEAIKYFIGVAKFKTRDDMALYGKNAIHRMLDQIAKEMGVEL